MISPAPYNRDTLKGILAAASHGETLEQHAARLGWTVSQLGSICANNNIKMKSVPGSANSTSIKSVEPEPEQPAATPPEVAAPIEIGTPPSHCIEAFGRKFDIDTRQVWYGRAKIQLSLNAFNVLLLLARAAPKEVSRFEIMRKLFHVYTPGTQKGYVSKACGEFKQQLGKIGLKLFPSTGYLSIGELKDDLARGKGKP